MKNLETLLHKGISRLRYLQWGLFFIFIKSVLDRLIMLRATGSAWRDLSSIKHYYFLGDSFSAAEGLLRGTGDLSLNLMLLIVALPFMAAGLLLTLQRLNVLRWHPWTLCFFFVPFVQWIYFMLLLSLPPDELNENQELKGDWLTKRFPNTPWASAAAAVLLVAPLGLLTVALSVYGVEQYSGFLFVGLPFGMGFIATCLYMPGRPMHYGEGVLVGQAAIALAGLGLLILAFEGIICIAMAAPLALALAWMGSSLAWSILGPSRKQALRAALLLSLALPALVGFESAAGPDSSVFSVHSEVRIQATPEEVWDVVVAFPQLPPPTDPLFRLGVAYPTHATINGHGVGAVRECHFSTGTFVEPITVWDEPHKLAFSVRSQPRPMTELSPYKNLQAPHLDGFLVSKKGQFELEALPDGGTLLKGTTWYQNSMGPEVYWRLWSDEIIHRIHLRVLEHIKVVAEGKRRAS